MDAFNPSHLRPLASLNRRKVIALPGVDPEIIGKTGAELLSKRVLIKLIAPYQQELGFDSAETGEYPEQLNIVLESNNQTRRKIAEAIAGEYGRRLGWLVASILLSPTGLTSPLDEWEAAYLDHWKTKVDELILGGGMSNRTLGKLICAQLESVLNQCGIADKRIGIAESPSYLALIGAARSLPPGMPGKAIVADFGQTRAKRGIAFLIKTMHCISWTVCRPMISQV